MTARGILAALRPVLVMAAALALAACGSRGAEEPADADAASLAVAAAAANRPPAFTSAAAVSVGEDRPSKFYTATATDPDGDALTFSLAGGADRQAFRITGRGALSFTIPLDFEVPADSDRNNVYLVRIAVSDGTTSAVLDLAVTVTNVGPDNFRVRLVKAGFSQPLFVAPVPDGSGRIFVVEKAGRIRLLNPNSGALAATPFLDLAGQVSTQGERGLLGLATAPDFAASGTFYVYLTNPSGTIELRRYRTLAGDRDRADPASADLILSIPHPDFGNHNGGWIGFGPDGALYVVTGDGGGSGDPNNNAQNRNVLLGKILRLIVTSDSFPDDPARDYAIPASNPFAGGGGRPEIWVYGLRNPFRASFDPATGHMWVGDVGQNAREEIDRLAPSDRGSNLGWDVLEGTAPFSGQRQPGMVPPVAEYLHGEGPRQGNSVTGGYVYRGPVEALRGQYFFADFVRGNLWSIPIAQVRLGATLSSAAFILRNADFTPNTGRIENVSSFGLDQAGNLYIVDYDGQIFRVEVR
ncbi:MAG TPA: PQQ-dependent sugar dehydrogenase [Solirubrobacterales bacterium]|nr:PQQ-dependent sugar dehydrogenase [Solirubrobacterales bacterium]